MHGAPCFTGIRFRFIKRIQKDCQKSQVIAEKGTAGRSGQAAQFMAYAAVNTAVPTLLIFIQHRKNRGYISEHVNPLCIATGLSACNP